MILLPVMAARGDDYKGASFFQFTNLIDDACSGICVVGDRAAAGMASV